MGRLRSHGILSARGPVHPSVSERISDVSGALTPHVAEVTADIYQLIVREIPQLRDDKRMLALLEASVGENVAMLLHVLQHGIDLKQVYAPAAAEEYARRLAQRSSFRKTSHAHGHGCHSAPRTALPSGRPAPEPPAGKPRSGSPSVLLPRVSLASAAPTSRP